MSSDAADTTTQPPPPLDAEEEPTLTLRIAPPTADAKSVRLEHVSAGDTVLALRQLIAEFPALAAYTCYRLEVFSASTDKWCVKEELWSSGGCG